MTTKRHNRSESENSYSIYQAEKRVLVRMLEGWVLGEIPEYPGEAVEDFLKMYAKDNELSRIIVVQQLAIDCLDTCFGQMGKLDARLMEQAKNVPLSEDPEEKESKQEEVYDVVFKKENDSTFKQINGTYEKCLSWIETNRKKTKSDFTDYKGGIVQIINLTREELAYEEFIPKE